MKKLFSLILIIIFLIGLTAPLSKSYADYSQMPAFLCEIGLGFYNQGRYDEALHEFKKALLVQSNYEPALKYIEMIEGLRRGKEEFVEVVPAYNKPKVVSSTQAVNEYLDLIEIQNEMLKEKQGVLTKKTIVREMAVSAAEKALPIQVVMLDESLNTIKKPIEIEQLKSIIIKGKNIERYLVTQADIVAVEKKNSDEIILTGKKIGYTYLHIWDNVGRWTLELLCVLPKPKGPTLEEEMRLEEERASVFKLRYSSEWHNFSQGARLDQMSRQYYSFDHNLSLDGATPYGNIDSLATIRTLNAKSIKKTTDLRYFTIGLTEGKIGNFKDFTLRGFDFYPIIDNFAFGGGTTLRGGMIESPAFNKKLDYIVFWGREGGGKFGPLSPGLEKLKSSYLSGGKINYTPSKKFSYDVSVFHGYGSERAINLPAYSYDADVLWRLERWSHNYEVAYESQNFAHLLSGRYLEPKTKFTYELRDVSKKFINIVGNVWRRGERGGLFTYELRPNEKLNIFNRLDVYQDRQFPAEDNKNRLNEDYDLLARYTIDSTAALRANYTLQNDLGKVSQIRYMGTGSGISKSFNLIRNISSNLDYRHQERKDYTNPGNDYINENISAGIRFSLVGQLYYFANQQWNWLEERFSGNHSHPQAFETGVDLSSQISHTSFYENIRFLYHNEENTASPLSFLSGEDYIEGYAALSYRPTPDTESYLSTRVRNVWADNPGVVKRIEADFNLGFRYLWDTGLHWESVGNIEGYVFRDLNSDGLRQKDEPPVEGIKVWLGKKRTAMTDLFGYYRFDGVRGRKAYIMLDAQSLPSGFVLTGPPRQDVAIEHYHTARADFGIISRSEISGIVFYDANDNGEWDSKELGIKNVRLILEDGKEVFTGTDGRYSFRNVLTGEHKIMLDLNSLPFDYLPKVPIKKELTLFEGVSYVYGIPLKRINK